MADENLRIGVFVCECGLNIASTIDCEELRRYAQTLEGVVIALGNKHSCAEPGQNEIKRAIKEHNLNRVVIAACTPRLHEPTFRACVAEAGLNPYLVEMVNIREQCSWVHLKDKQAATRKAKDMVKMAVARARYLQAQTEAAFPVTKAALVIGGGIAGIQAALDLADAGHQVYMVERKPSIGGIMAQLDKTFPTMDCAIWILGPKMADVGRHPRIKVMVYSEVEEVSGYIGNFTVRVRRKARYVREKDCTACGDCAQVCPITRPDEYQIGFATRKAIHIPFPQAVPASYVVNIDECMGNNPIACAKCMEKCQQHCIDFDMQDETVELKVGVIIVATGAEVFDPSSLSEYGYGRFENVITSLEFERLSCAGGPTAGQVIRPTDGAIPKKIGFIQCVGSRDLRQGSGYCSNICCMNTIKNSLLLKDRYPGIEVYVFYIDIRAFGKGFEELYRRSKEAGVRYVRGLPGEISEDPATRNLIISVENTTARRLERYELDMVVLSVGLQPRREDPLGKIGLSRTSEGFLLESHPKLKPVDAPTAGIFFAGCAEAPKDIKDSVTQASAAAARASAILNSSQIKVEAITALVDQGTCTACGVCARVCPYRAVTVDVRHKVPAQVIEPACAGCGTCASECTFDAITMRHFSDQQLLAQLEAALEQDPQDKIVAFACNWCSYAGADMAGVSGLQYPPTTRLIRTMCSGRVDEKFIWQAFRGGAPLVLVSGCHMADCHYIDANRWTQRRVDRLWNKMERLGIRPERLQLEWISAAEGQKFARVMRELEEMRGKVTDEEIEYTVRVLEAREKGSEKDEAVEAETATPTPKGNAAAGSSAFHCLRCGQRFDNATSPSATPEERTCPHCRSNSVCRIKGQA